VGRPRRVYRQGDLVLIEEMVLDLDPAVKEGEALVIASENGNRHRLASPVYTVYGRRYVVVEKPSVLTHPQHPELVVEPGIYRVEFVRDFALNRAVD